MNRPWKLVLLLSGIFLAGGVTGSLLTFHFGRQWLNQRPPPEQWAPVHLQKLSRRLELTPAQVEQLRPIIRRHMEELGRVRSESLGASRGLVERMQREIAEQLTPEQREKFDDYNRQMRERMRKFMQKKAGEQRGRGERPDAPPPPEAAPRAPGN
jgi:Spy/CpxP family protein refolding chaperone